MPKFNEEMAIAHGSAGQPTFPKTGRPDENQVLALPYLCTREKTGEQRTTQSACGATVDFLGNRVGEAQLRTA